MNRRPGVVLSSIVLVCALSSPALATLDITLSLDNPIQMVGPTDAVELWATLINELSSDETLNEADNNGAYIVNGTLIDLSPGSGNPYTIDFGSFNPGDLAPGDSYNFLFATLLPDPAPVVPGTYTSNGIGLDYLIGGNFVSFSSTSGISVTVVPEPQALALLLLGSVVVGPAVRRR